MPNWLEIVLLAVASMFWPTLITIVVLALRVPHPVRILFWFVLGGLLTTITIGLLLVFALQDISFVSGSSRSVNPVLNIAGGSARARGCALPDAGAGTAPRRRTESVSTEQEESGLAAACRRTRRLRSPSSPASS